MGIVAAARRFLVTGKNLYWIEPDGSSLPVPSSDPGARSGSLRVKDLATGKVHTIRERIRDSQFGLSVSPDERYILWAQDDHSGSDIKMIENFR